METNRVMELKAVNIQAGYDKKMILQGLDVTIPQGKISVIIGANACGKSTLLKTFARLLHVKSGQILLNMQEINTYPSKRLARKLGLLPQSPIVPEGITVYDLVSRGRFSYQGFLKGMTEEDHMAVLEAMEIMNIVDLKDRFVDELSGGQRQRVWIAMALAQRTDILILDEPTTFLDISYQVEILDMLTDLNHKYNTTILMVLHDINLSARYADYMFALKDGRLISQGTPEEVIQEETIWKVFSLTCKVMKDPVSQSPFIIPIGRHHKRQIL